MNYMDEAVKAAVKAYLANERAVPEALDAGCDLSELPSSLNVAVKAARPHEEAIRADERNRIEEGLSEAVTSAAVQDDASPLMLCAALDWLAAALASLPSKSETEGAHNGD